MNLALFEPEVNANLERAEESLRAAQLLYAWSWDFWYFCKRPPGLQLGALALVCR